MTERLPCQTEGCRATILPTTAAKTGGYCMPCHQEQERQKRQAYIEKHRRTVNVYEGVTDRVEILKLMHTPAPYDPLIQYVPYPLAKEQVYESLTDEEAVRMRDYALELLAEGDQSRSRDILSSLVCYRNMNIADCLPELLNREMYRPAILYKDAAPEVRDPLLERVEEDDKHRSDILLALSWIGDSAVVGRFREWRASRPSWAERLYVAPEAYAPVAGWELAPEGDRRDLVHGPSYPVQVKADAGASSRPKTDARFLSDSDCACPWCGGKLTILMDADTAHPSLAHLNLTLDRLQIATCVRCGCYGDIYMELDAGGAPQWSGYNRTPDYLPDQDEQDEAYGDGWPELVLSSEPRSPFYAAIWELSQHGTQLGGHPSWIQDAYYPPCPCCSKSMRFVGQIAWEDIEDYGEGIYYMYVCPEDRLTATTYQQS